MCGIYGWSFAKRARVPAGQREVLAACLAVSNSQRGDQSWGYYAVNNEGATKIVKRVGDVARASGIARWGRFPTFFAHTRYATRGALTQENAHPFHVGKIVLAHNGAVWNHDRLNVKYDRNCEVDSMHFAHHIDAGLPFDDLEGYGAIEWVEEGSPDAVNICRMEMGSLAAYGIEVDGKQVGTVWSSDADHLKAAIGMARLDAFPYKRLAEGQVYRIVKGKLYIRALTYALSDRDWRYHDWESSYRATSGGLVGKGESNVLDGFRWDPNLKCYVRNTQALPDEPPAPLVDDEGVVDTEALIERHARWLLTLSPIGNGQWVTEDGRTVDLDEDDRAFLREISEEQDLPPAVDTQMRGE